MIIIETFKILTELLGLLKYLKDFAPQFLSKILILFQDMIARGESCAGKYSDLLKEYPEISIMDLDLVNCLTIDDYLNKNTINEYTRLARRDGINVSEDELLTSIGSERKKEFLYDDEEYR